ncbi:MAG: branched-chain amino acid ABC transporter permease [Burkholderiaceae bacterium]|nr:branched-chain amino acid ABC transporter permease [Burkholderiaceae bacterium]
MTKNSRRWLPIVVFGVLAAAPMIAHLLNQAYYITFLSRVMIFGLAALSLNLVLGFGGLTSLGHAAFMGVGAYCVGLLMQYGVTNGFVHFTVVMVLGALIALLIGSICLRTSGLAFIMLTLAFAQLLFFIGTGLKQYGGDDGFSFRGRSDFGLLGSLGNETALYYFILGWLALATFIVARVVDSRFGMALRGIKSNEARMTSIGLHPYRYKLVAFVISGTICSVAGGLLANLAQFVSPSYTHWSRSAEMLLMVLLGGMSSIMGPLAGAAVFMVLEDVLGHFTIHWQAPMGLILMLIVIYARNGLSDIGELLAGLVRRLRGGASGGVGRSQASAQGEK